MAAIAFNTALHAAARLEAALSAVRERIDAFVSYQMQLVATRVERTNPSQCELTAPDETRGRGDESTSNAAQFQPLDTGIISDAIPAFFIGRNKDGLWVAREARGRIGGLFLFKRGALSFAKKNSQPTGCATIYPAEAVELDLRNMGNPIVARLGALKRLATGVRQRIATLIA